MFISRGAIWTFSALYSFFLMIGFYPKGFFRFKVFNETVEARPIRFHNYGSSKGECYENIVIDLPYISCTYWKCNILTILIRDYDSNLGACLYKDPLCCLVKYLSNYIIIQIDSSIISLVFFTFYFIFLIYIIIIL